MYEHLMEKKLTKEDKKYFEEWILNERKLSEIEKIINLRVFKDHPELLTPSAFLKTAEEIEEIVDLKVFKDHPELLTPVVFYSTKQKILDVYSLYCLYKVESYISSSHLKLSVNEVRAKINFLDDMNLPITIETGNGKIKLHPIMLMTSKNMKLNYGITKKELIKKYTYVDADKDDYKKSKRC